MSISRRHLRRWLVVAGCLFAQVRWPVAGWGLGLVIAGSALHLVTKAYLRQNQVLTTAGPYRFTRNPFYLANALIELGLLCVIGKLWVAAVYIPVWWFAYRAVIREEESQLSALFGEAFEAYRSAVPVLVPCGAPWPLERAEGTLDWQNPNLAEGREYARLLGIAMGPAAIWASEWVRAEGAGLFEAEHAAILGAVLLVPVFWILKLALAETFRRPDQALLPGDRGGKLRTMLSALVFLPLVCVVFSRGEQAQVGGILTLTLASVYLAAEARASTEALPILRWLASLGLAAASLVFGLQLGMLWLSVIPVLWFGLSGLDDLGAARHARSAARSNPRGWWRYGPRVAGGAVVAWLLVGTLVAWVQPAAHAM